MNDLPAMQVTVRAYFDPSTKTWGIESETWHSGPAPLPMFAAAFGCIHGAMESAKQSLTQDPSVQAFDESSAALAEAFLAEAFDQHSRSMSEVEHE